MVAAQRTQGPFLAALLTTASESTRQPRGASAGVEFTDTPLLIETEFNHENDEIQRKKGRQESSCVPCGTPELSL